jgi:hypothetical protein
MILVQPESSESNCDLLETASVVRLWYSSIANALTARAGDRVALPAALALTI